MKKVQHLLKDDEYFFANYSDGLTDMPLPKMLQKFKRSGKVAAFVCTPPSQTFHVVKLANGSRVTRIKPVSRVGLVVNAGFFSFRRDIFDYIREGEDLVGPPFERLIKKNLIMGYKYDRFWCMDTFKEQQELSDLCTQGDAPWEIWKLKENR
jgi:glucose-1-phosphate cytidylyltransferase